MHSRAWFLGLVVSTTFGCDPTQTTDDGTTFSVTAVMSTNSCGPQSVPAASISQYQAQIGVKGAQATWHVSANGARATGEYSAGVRGFRFAADSSSTYRAADRISGRAACVMRRLDIIDGTLAGGTVTPTADMDAGTDNGTSFQATETILFGPVSGADCSDYIGASDGQFSTLPCTIVYQMSGAMVVDQSDAAVE